MRKLFVIMFCISVTMLSAENVYTSDGLYLATCSTDPGWAWAGAAMPTKIMPTLIQQYGSSKVVAGLLITSGQEQAIRQLTARYNTKAGDVFLIVLAPQFMMAYQRYVIVVQFSTPIDLEYWCMGVLR